VRLGRPSDINDAHVDQRYQRNIDDSDLLPAGKTIRSIQKDCTRAAPVMHVKLTRMVKQAFKEQALARFVRNQHIITTA
jgi:hypothetical protein